MIIRIKLIHGWPEKTLGFPTNSESMNYLLNNMAQKKNNDYNTSIQLIHVKFEYNVRIFWSLCSHFYGLESLLIFPRINKDFVQWS